MSISQNKDFKGKKKTVIYSLPKLMEPGHRESFTTAGTSQVLMQSTPSFHTRSLSKMRQVPEKEIIS